MSKYELNTQQVATRRLFDIPVLIAALLTIPVMIAEGSDLPAGYKMTGMIVNWFIWTVFLIDLVAMTAIADDKKSYLRYAWVDVLIVATSFPVLTRLDVLRLLRIGRLSPALRILRLVRLAAVVTRGSKVAKDIFGQRGFVYVSVVTLFLVVGFAVAALLIEPEIGTIDDALWWSVVTITTVGYGDLSPASAAGRITGAVLMFVGIGVVGVVTGLVASVMLDESAHDAETLARLESIEVALRELKTAQHLERRRPD